MVFFIGLIIGLLTWFSRRYTASILSDNQELTDSQTNSEQRLKSETGHYRQVIEAIEQRMQSIPLTDQEQVQYVGQWVSAWNDYFLSTTDQYTINL